MTFDKDFDELLDKFVEDYLNKQENEFEPTHEADPKLESPIEKIDNPFDYIQVTGLNLFNVSSPKDDHEMCLDNLSSLPQTSFDANKLKKLPDGRLAQRLSPRRKNSHWTKLNMDRCMDLEDRGLMTPAGKRALKCIAIAANDS